MEQDHIHDCTGPDRRCPCGFVFTVPRFAVSFDVYDNQAGASIVDDGFSTDSIGVAVGALREAMETLERLR